MPNVGGVFGNYRIDDVIFPVPATTWEDPVIATGLNGIPIINSYRIHRWNWSSLEGEIAKQVYEKFAEQQAGNAQLTSLETDPYGADLATASYGTTVYTDFVIVEISPRNRSLPFYENVQITFEVYVG